VLVKTDRSGEVPEGVSKDGHELKGASVVSVKTDRSGRVPEGVGKDGQERRGARGCW
jgi:hypothetical protein